MSATATIQELNRELAKRINAEARSNPQSPYANKFVGIANGQVVVVFCLSRIWKIAPLGLA